MEVKTIYFDIQKELEKEKRVRYYNILKKLRFGDMLLGEDGRKYVVVQTVIVDWYPQIFRNFVVVCPEVDVKEIIDIDRQYVFPREVYASELENGKYKVTKVTRISFEGDD